MDGLVSILAIVHDDTIALLNVLFSAYPGHSDHKMANQSFITLLAIDQRMHRVRLCQEYQVHLSDRFQRWEHYDFIVLIQYRLRGLLALDNLVKWRVAQLIKRDFRLLPMIL